MITSVTMEVIVKKKYAWKMTGLGISESRFVSVP